MGPTDPRTKVRTGVQFCHARTFVKKPVPVTSLKLFSQTMDCSCPEKKFDILAQHSKLYLWRKNLDGVSTSWFVPEKSEVTSFLTKLRTKRRTGFCPGVGRTHVT